MNTLENVQYAALINLGCNPFISLIVTILVVGFIVWLVQLLLPYAPVSDPFKTMVGKIVLYVGIAYCFLVALQIIFGIQIIAGVTAIGCG